MTANFIHLGQAAPTTIPAGEVKVDLQIFHTLFAGQTQLSGKTTTIRTLAPRAVKEGYTVLIFDTKPNAREFEGYSEVKPCYRDPLDALVLIGLLESIRKARLSPYYATLSRLVEDAKDLQDIVDNAEQMEERSRSGWVKDACHTLADLIRRLIAELSETELSPTLELKDRIINVMPINELSVEAQQLVIKTAFEIALKWSKPLILVVDESWRFLPEQYSSACKRSIQDYVTQGAKTKKFCWLATQFLAPTDKDALKAMANKLLGRQDHNTEVEHEQKLIPEDKKDWPRKVIMTLKPGEFIFVPMDGQTRKIYIDAPVLEKEVRFSAYKVPREVFKNIPNIIISMDDESTGITIKGKNVRPITGEITIDEGRVGLGVVPPRADAERKVGGSTTLEPEHARRTKSSAALPPRSGVKHTEVASPSPRPESIDLEPPEPETKTLAAFTIQVTRLQSSSLEGKIGHVIKHHGGLRQAEIIRKALDYGWNLQQSTVSDALKAMVEDGLLVTNSNHDYKFAPRIQVEEIAA